MMLSRVGTGGLSVGDDGGSWSFGTFRVDCAAKKSLSRVALS